MEEKKIVYEVIISIWNIAKEHGFDKLTDNQWESFVEKGMQENKRFKQYGESVEMLYRGMFDALQNYYERKNHG